MEKKTKTYKLKNSDKLREISYFENLNMSEMIDFLIENYEMGLKPHKKLDKLQTKREEKSGELTEIDNQIKETNNQISQMQEWNEKKAQGKEKAIHIIKRILLQKKINEAQRVSKVWASMTGIPATQLLLEAQKLNKVNYNLIREWEK